MNILFLLYEGIYYIFHYMNVFISSKTFLTFSREYDFNQSLVGDFRGTINELQNVVGVVLVPEQEQPVPELVDPVIRYFGVDKIARQVFESLEVEGRDRDGDGVPDQPELEHKRHVGTLRFHFDSRFVSSLSLQIISSSGNNSNQHILRSFKILN